MELSIATFDCKRIGKNHTKITDYPQPLSAGCLRHCTASSSSSASTGEIIYREINWTKMDEMANALLAIRRISFS